MARRLREALDRRLARLDLAYTNAFRWLHGEGDLLPGLHVDVYDDVAVYRFDGEGARPSTSRWRTSCAPPRRTAWPCAPSSTARAATAGRRRAHRAGGRPEVRRRPGARAEGRPLPGPAREPAARRRRWPRARACSTSSATRAASRCTRPRRARRGPTRSTSPRQPSRPRGATSSSTSLPIANAGFHADDAFEFLEDASKRGDTWDIVVSDPPSFAPRRDAVPAARAAYTRLHRLAALVTAPRGLLCAASCSSHVGRTTSCRRSRTA